MDYIPEQVTTVSQVNEYIKNMFVREYALHNICIRGEISNYSLASSGHLYFTLKDEASELPCVMYRSALSKVDFQMKSGQSVVVQGSITTYEKKGRYQFQVQKAYNAGKGELYEKYERLKKRLGEEGLFDEARKKRIPLYVRKIGVVTSASGAVIHDICDISKRRNPFVQICLYPAMVQGEGAHRTIIRGIRYFEATDVDVIIIGRGGGSIEDLWEFNEEELAYVIADCEKPVISAVGHETDFSISDFAADLRAATPSEAAELAVFDYEKFMKELRQYEDALHQQMGNKIRTLKLKTAQYTKNLEHLSPTEHIKRQRLRLDSIEVKLKSFMQQRLEKNKHRLALCIEELKGLSPLYKLQAGYVYVEDEEGRQIRTASEVETGQALELTFSDGKVTALAQGKILKE